jgi:RNA polymerase sigma-70 factor (ECF subfamily)
MDEREAVARLQRGDPGGLEELVRQHQARALRAAWLITHDTGLAEDAVQIAFLRAYAHIGQFDAARPFAPWFGRIVVREAARLVTPAAQQSPFDLTNPDHPFDLPTPDSSLDDRLEALETAQAIRAALAQLTPGDRAVLVGRYYLDLNATELAAQLHAPPGTIRWRLHAARQRLRSLLPAWLHPRSDIPPEEPRSTP